jgi:hypothetical protein
MFKKCFALALMLSTAAAVARSQSLDPPESFSQQWLHEHERTQPPAPPIDIPNPRVDPTKIDILGFKLSMTGEEAVANAAKRFGATKKCPWGIGVKEILPCIEISTVDTTYTPKAKYISRVSVSTEKVLFIMDFTETFPFEPKRPELLTHLRYIPQGLKTQADSVAFTEMVVAKFGLPPNISELCARGWPKIGVDSEQINYEDLNKTPRIMQGWTCAKPVLYFSVHSSGNIGEIDLDAGNELADREHELWESQRKGSLPPL